MTTYERRVTLALKWHHLDNLSPEEIQERFVEEDVGEYTLSTIRGYLNSEPADEVVEQIEKEHANVRLQSAERYERLYQRAREAEREATRDEWIEAAEPVMDRVAEYEEPLRVADWERMPPGDDRRPEWADERDTIVVFVDDDRHLQAGEEYPAGARRGGQPARPGTFPEFRTSRVALERDVDDPKGEAMARQEQAKYQREKGDVLGVYKDRVELTGAAGAPIEVEITNNIVETDDNE